MTEIDHHRSWFLPPQFFTKKMSSAATKPIYGSLPTTEEQKQHLIRIKEAQEYLASHRVKEIYSKLVYELVVNRPNHAVPFMIERLKEIKEIGLDKPRQPKPRLISVVTDCKDDFEINQAIKHAATDFNMKMYVF